MPALELLQLDAWRVVATPDVLDAAADVADMIRIASDEALFVGEDSPAMLVSADSSTIVEPDAGWSGAWMSESSFVMMCAHAIDWKLPTNRPALAQGLIAGVPGKVWMTEDSDDVLLLVPWALAYELIERLG